MVYALREALRLIVEEGLEKCWERHRKNAEDLWKGLEDMVSQVTNQLDYFDKIKKKRD